ncbi:MAG TPA: hypothetical protein VM120_05275 [Bryobacteraceae bacterium]|nr:hypothetical protein [Bryobacteraceae bacterium]
MKNLSAFSSLLFLAAGTNKERPFGHRLKEKFHQFQFNFYKEREMSDFRKLLLAFACITLFAGFASAQTVPPIVCSTSAQPLTVRAEGLTEQTGDIVMSCTGGQAPIAGAAVPAVNISVTLSVNITSRLVADPITEALLFIDDPQPAQQNPCVPAAGSTVCQGTGYTSNGAGGSLGTGGQVAGAPINVFQGVRQNDNTIVFLAVPISAPGSTGTRLFRTKNIRAAVAGSSATNGQIFAFVSIQNPPANLQLNNSTLNVAFVQQGLAFSLRSRSGGGFSATDAPVALFACDTFNRDLFNANTANYGGGGFGLGRAFELRFREAYAASFKVRDVNSPTFSDALSQNIPQNNNGADPSISTVVESGFFNLAFPTTNGLNRAGRADHGTRLRAVFNNVPANVKLFVTAHPIQTGTFVNASQSALGGESTAFSAAYGVAASTAGNNVAAGTVLANPTSAAELFTTSTAIPGTLGYPAGAVAGLVEVPIVAGSGSFTWEVFRTDPNQIDTFSFGVAIGERSTSAPGLGTFTVNGSFAPVTPGANTMSSTQPIPRFADQSTPQNAASVNTCLSTLLFPFVANQGGFDTGIAIANTSADPFGTAPQTGNCELNYYGGTTGGGAAPSKQTTTTTLKGGDIATFTLSSGGTNGVAATPGFLGYIIAICQFRYAHGFAFISDVGAQRLSHGYLALVLDTSPRVNNLNAESLGQ